jgi:23S rRNA pseudouridine1911/1915/1917 synthase
MRLERPFLHASRLVFSHPSDGRRMEFASPLPVDLQRILDELHERQESKSPEKGM